MNPLPKFVVQSPPIGDSQVPPPYGFDNVGLQLFLVRADGSQLQNICDEFFNNILATAYGRFRIGPLRGNLPGIVNVGILHYSKMYSRASGHEHMGFSRQNELLISIPVVLRNSAGIPLAVGAFSPFIYVDNALSLITGRDVVGFTKDLGKFSVSAQSSDIGVSQVSTLAIKSYSSNQAIESKPLLETYSVDIEALLQSEPIPAHSTTENDRPLRLQDELAKPLWPFGPVEQLYAGEEDFAVDKRIFNLLKQSAGVRMKNYTLKQLRDAETPDRACYQAIVEGTTDLRRFYGGGVLPRREITLHKYDSVNIIERLGLDAQGSKVDPVYGFWYRADFDLKNLRNLSGVEIAGSGRASQDCLHIWATGVISILNFYGSMADAWLRVSGSNTDHSNQQDR